MLYPLSYERWVRLLAVDDEALQTRRVSLAVGSPTRNRAAALRFVRPRAGMTRTVGSDASEATAEPVAAGERKRLR